MKSSAHLLNFSYMILNENTTLKSYVAEKHEANKENFKLIISASPGDGKINQRWEIECIFLLWKNNFLKYNHNRFISL